jgi:drug/metabolite transporter (DMT)-like permease
MQAPRMGAAEWTLLLTLSILWGGSYFFAKVALAEIGPLTVAFLRVSIAALALHVILRALGVAMPNLRDEEGRRWWVAFLVMGTINNAIPFALIFWGTARIESGLAAILNATTPMFTAIVAHALTRDEKLSARKVGAIVMGLAGVAVLMGPDALSGLGENTLAQAACVLGAVSYAFAGVYGRRFKPLPSAAVACGQVTASSFLLLPVALLVEAPLERAAPNVLSWSVIAWGAVAGLALISTALGYMVYFRILQRAGATNLLLVTFLIPPSAILLGTFILGEVLAPRHFAGMALIGLGLAAMDGRVFQMFRKRSPRGELVEP